MTGLFGEFPSNNKFWCFAAGLQMFHGFHYMVTRLLTFASALLVASGCNDSLDRPIHFHIPTDFSGPFVIVSDPHYDDTIDVKADRYELTVPDDGIIRTNNTDIFTSWHKTTASDLNGNDIPYAASLHAGPTGGSNNVRYISWYYVGTYDDFHAFMFDDMHPKKRSEWLEQQGVSY